MEEALNKPLTGEALDKRLRASEWSRWRADRLAAWEAKQAAAKRAAERAAELEARLDRIEAGEDEEGLRLREAAYGRITQRLADGDSSVWEELQEFWEDLGSAHRRVRDLEIAHKTSYPELWIENALQRCQYDGEWAAYCDWQTRQAEAL